MKRFMNPAALVLLVLLALTFSQAIRRDPGGWIINELLMLPGIIIGLCFHEYAHGIVAYKLGDPTPKFQGRLTVNPGAHLDPIGFLALLFVGFGWGRPVEINPYNFKKPRRDEFLVAIAGVAMNFIIAVVFAFIYKLVTQSAGIGLYTDGIGGYICWIIFYIIYMNVILMLFNLLPVPPLDGFNIVTEIFDLKRYSWYYTLYQNGFFILMLLILFNVTDTVLTPLINGVMNFMISIAGFGLF